MEINAYYGKKAITIYKDKIWNQEHVILKETL